MSERIIRRVRRAPVTKEGVFEAASVIAQSGQMPTLNQVRAHLGTRSSETTLNKYLAQWKQALLVLAVQVSQSTPGEIGSNIEWVQEKAALENALKSESSKIRVLSAELIQTEQENGVLKALLETTEKNLTALTERYQALAIKEAALERGYQAVQSEREAIVDALFKDKNQQIEVLHTELKAVHQDNLEYIKKIGVASDEALIQEKVKAIHLGDKVDALTQEVKRLGAAVDSEKALNRSLVQKVRTLSERSRPPEADLSVPRFESSG